MATNPKIVPSTSKQKNTEKAKNTFFERSNEFSEMVKKRLEHAKELKLKQDMKECTFIPKTARQSDRRNLDDFLKAQEEYVNKRKEKLNRLSETSKSKLESSLMKAPKINEKSRVLVEKKSNNEPVHKRLFEMSKKHLTIESNNQSPIRKPSINTPRTGRQLDLYEDAKRRMQRTANSVKPVERKSEIIQPSKDQFVVQKFVKDYYRMLKELNLNSVSQFSFDQMSIFLEVSIKAKNLYWFPEVI